ncbi:peptidyl-prolyl cis-trans isomerase [Treponema sp. OMZ 792]|uniref:peptidylprolyl isomerase n=1 Tax=unclassified Treponema TaxID=2638727 RepID=UPI0020A568DD|nr:MULTISPECIES: peptidylprolyl isomerase [unclassified Treponema]UTC74485.1 peptidyl-prolyl cis-trans isomerase [Treponema sp. OMZ 792]UTC80881.1 peptidyl-prolyl cis-trans isomerase [Treponema sp. OMZ 798]
MASSKKVAASIGGIIVFVLGVIAFVVAPMVTDRASQGFTVVGKWGNVRIDNGPSSPFVDQYHFLANYVERQKIEPEDAQMREFFWQQLSYLAFRAAVVQVAMEDEVINAGYRVPQFRVNKDLINYYLDENGVYSETRYRQTPETTRVTYRKEIEKYIKDNRYIEDLFGNGNSYGLKTSSNETDFIVDMAKKERSFKYVVFNLSLYPSSEIVKYGKEHSDLFTSYDLSLLSYPTEEEAKKMLASLKSGEVSFEDAVILNATKTLTDESGKITSNYRTDINRYFPDNEHLKAVLALKPSDLSPVVSMQNGMFGIVRCNAEPSLPDFESESLISNIRNYMNRNEKGMLEDYVLQTANKFAENAKALGLEKAAEDFKETTLTVETSNLFGINYGNASSLPPLPAQGVFAALSKNEAFFKKAFALKSGEISEPILAGSEVAILTLAEEKEIDSYTMDRTKTDYQNQAGAWFPYYHIAAIMSMQGMNYPLPIAHKTFMDYIFTNAKFQDNFGNLFK